MVMKEGWEYFKAREARHIVFLLQALNLVNVITRRTRKDRQQ